MNILVSVIVPCYMQGQYLSEALDSVMDQTYQDWECIIVNDGSTDNTEAVAEEYCKKDKRFHYYYQSNGGVSSARNCGIRKSSGKYVLPLDPDDRIHKRYIELAVRQFADDPDTKLVYGRTELFGTVNGVWECDEYRYEDFIWANMIVNSSFFKREDFDEVGGYNTNMVHGYEDWDFWLSILNPDDKVIRIDDEPMYFYRQKTVSRSTELRPYVDVTLRQIVLNHPHIYEPYLSELLLNKRMLDYYRTSLPYRLGLKILKPYRKVKQFLTHRFYKDVQDEMKSLRDG